MSKGMIISIEGGARSGKTFLIKRLAERLQAHMHVELDEAFPDRLIEDMEKNIRPFERIIWFRNQVVKQFLDAVHRRDNGEIVITDGFWNSNSLFIDTLFDGNDQFEKELCESISNLDRELLPLPDKIIFLELSDELTKKFVSEGGRDFDSSNDYLDTQILPVKRKMEEFYGRPENQKNLIKINREKLDFLNDDDLDKVIEMIGLK